MSQKQASLPDATTAYNTLFNGPYAGVFFNQLATRGIVPQTEKEAFDLLELAGQLRVLAPQVEKVAESRFAGAVAATNGLLSRYGYGDRTKVAAAQERETAFRAEAARLAADPALYNAALAFKAAQTDQVR